MNYLVVISGIISFSTFTFILVFILRQAGLKLLPQGNVNININDKDNLTVKPGSSLLELLTEQKVFLPSACGGGGTCAMCKCQVMSGGGDVLPTEKSHFSRQEIKDNWRLSCQLKVKDNLNIHIEDEIFNIKKYNCVVKSNDNVATFIKELVLELPKNVDLNFKSGGYIQIDIPKYNIAFNQFDIQNEYHEDWDKYKIWDLKCNNDEPLYKAYSMANHPAEGDIVMLNVRIATPPPSLWNQVPPGKASSYIFNLKKGDPVTVSGPFGEFFIKDTEREMLYIGGGAGMAPLRSHIFHLLKTQKTKRKISFWYGARSLKEMFYDDEFKALEKEFPNFSYNVALSEPFEEDKWKGFVGFIHQVAFDNYLNNHSDPTEIEYYMCGPPPMIDAADKMLYDLGVEPEMIAYDKFG
mgnify:CR=1 FL=1